LEASLRGIHAKLDRHAALGSDTSALTSTLHDLTARLDEAFLRPAVAAKIDLEPIEDLARRIESVRATVERATDFLPDAARLDAALAGMSAKLDRQAFSPADVQALTAVLQELATRIDEGSNRPIDTTPIERILQDFGDRPVSLDTTPIEAMLRDLGEKFAAVAIDTTPIERMLSRVDAKLDAVGRIPMDVRPLEQSLRDLHEKMDFREAPGFDPRLIEQAADLLAKRLEQRDGSGVDAEALVGQISEIHGRLDSLNLTSQSNATLEHTVAELLYELETTRKTLQSSASAPHAADPALGDLAELRAEQINSDRRVQARLAEVQNILEELVSRLGRIEDDPAQVEEDEPEPRRAVPAPFGLKPAPAGGAEPNDAALRSIPDRTPLPQSGERNFRGFAPRGTKPVDRTDIPLEPAQSAPPRKPERQPASAPPGKSSGINTHIAAARRAAQAALLESASKTREPLSSSILPRPRVGLRGSPLKQAQEFLVARRRPVLLGIAFLAIVTTLTVVGFRSGSHPQPVQKSELSAPIQTPAPAASTPQDRASSKPAANVDYSPVGTVAAARTPLPAAIRPPPADLVAALPAGVTGTLHDAATSGDTGAETELALRYLEGRTLPRDPKMAARWFEQAAVQGLPIAQYRLAALYEKGTGVTRDVQLARSWYLKAATAGNARAMHNLAVLDAEDAGAGKPDYAEAAQWFRRAAELGIRDSQFNLAVLLGRGLGVPQDLGQSWIWFTLASRQGDADAEKKRDEVAAKMDSKAMAAATAALTAMKMQSLDPTANEAPAPPGGWDAKAGSAQAARESAPAPVRAVAGYGAHG
jgi:localization factor PodJL